LDLFKLLHAKPSCIYYLLILVNRHISGYTHTSHQRVVMLLQLHHVLLILLLLEHHLWWVKLHPWPYQISYLCLLHWREVLDTRLHLLA
jgi:hypothetical protein